MTEAADFQKDLSLDSLDRVELVMAFEQEFSIQIPDDKADKLTCCADVAKYISESQISDKNAGGSWGADECECNFFLYLLSLCYEGRVMRRVSFQFSNMEGNALPISYIVY